MELFNKKENSDRNVKPTVREFVVGDEVILRHKYALFQDKMKSEYSNKVYTVTDSTPNSLKLIDYRGYEKIYII